jgi:hypothetical protein
MHLMPMICTAAAALKLLIYNICAQLINLNVSDR